MRDVLEWRMNGQLAVDKLAEGLIVRQALHEWRVERSANQAEREAVAECRMVN